MIAMSAHIEAEYVNLNGYEARDNVLYLRIRIKSEVSTPSPFIIIPKLHYDVYLDKCENGKIPCSRVSQDSIYHGEFNWLTISCPPCNREVELQITLDKELIDKLVSIVEDGKEPAFDIQLSMCPYVTPYVMASVPLPSANANVMIILGSTIRGPIKGNLGDYIVFSSDDIRNILNKINYVERIKMEVEVKLPETTEGLPKPLIDAIKALKAAFNDINNLDFANAIIKCRSAIEYITKHEKRGDENVRVIKNEVKDAILSKYDGVVKDFCKGVLDDILEVTIRKTYTMISRFVHPDSSKVESYPRMDDAIYICRQTLGIIECLVELSQAYSYWVNTCASAA
jgi:hypothetical protein